MDKEQIEAQSAAAEVAYRAMYTGFSVPGFAMFEKGWLASATASEGRIAELEAQVENLNDCLDEASNSVSALSALLPGSYYMDPPDGGSVTLIEQVRRIAEDAARYRWLRNGSSTNRAPHVTQYPYSPGDNPRYPQIRDVGMDAAIDFARAALAGSATPSAKPDEVPALIVLRAQVQEMHDAAYTFGEYSKDAVRIVLDGVINAIDLFTENCAAQDTLKSADSGAGGQS